MIWSLFSNTGNDGRPNLSEEYLVHDGTDYRFNEEKLEEIRSENPKMQDYKDQIYELNFLINDVNILPFVVGREDERYVNTICEFVFRDEESIFFRNTRITFRDDSGEVNFLSEELETLFMPYLLCIYGALDALYKELLEEKEARRKREKEIILDCLKEDLESLTYKEKD